MVTDARQSLPVYLKVAGDLRRSIAEGEAKPGGAAAPPATWRRSRGVNQNTMFRALRHLREEGPLEFRRGRGIIVSGTPERGALILRARELLDFARAGRDSNRTRS